MKYSAYQKYERDDRRQPLPKGWASRRLKFMATCNDEALGDATDPEYVIEYVDISSVNLVEGITKTEPYQFSDAPSRARRKVRDGDTIISTVRTYLKAIAPIVQPPPNMIVSTGFAVIRPLPGIESRFLGYALQSTVFIESVVANSKGVSYPSINATVLTCLSLSYPTSLGEQTQIASFLDWKTAQIDTLLAKKHRLLEKLKEQRLSIITHAVTSDLHGQSPTRETDVAWLGALPKHWKVVPLGFLVSISGGMTPSMGNSEYWDGDIPWVTPKDMKRARIIDSIDHVTETALAETSLRLIPEGAILIVVRGMILAHSFPTALTGCPVTINQDMKALRCGEELLPEYLYWTLTGFAQVFSKLAEESAHGTRKMESETIKRFQFPVPPLKEQKTIVKELARRIEQLDELMDSTMRTIMRLEEYRTALITNATTGNIDVSHVKPTQSK